MTFYCQWIGLVNSQENPIFNGKTFGFLKVFPTEPIHRYRLTNGNLTSSEPKTSHFAFIPKKNMFFCIVSENMGFVPKNDLDIFWLDAVYHILFAATYPSPSFDSPPCFRSPITSNSILKSNIKKIQNSHL